MLKMMVTTILLITSSCLADDDLVIQAKINQDFSSKYIAMINFEIKNNTQDWIILSNPKINFSEKADKYIITSSKNHKEYGYLNQLTFNYEQNKNHIQTKLTFRNSQFNEDEPKDILGNIPKNSYVWQSDL